MPTGVYQHKNRSEETKKKFVESRRKNGWFKNPEETKRKIGNSNRGKVRSEESKNNLSNIKRGRKMNDETKIKIGNSNRGKTRTEEIRKRFSESHKGKKLSEETKKRMGISLKGRKAWNKGLTKDTDERVKKYSLSNSKSKKGIKLSEQTRRKLSESHKGEKSYLWKGGITPINLKIRKSFEYKLWRKAVFERDNYTCIWCGAIRGNEKKVILHADHIKPFALFPELRFAIDNGRTLCKDCHEKTDTYGGRYKK